MSRIGIVAAMLLICFASSVSATPQMVVVERFSRCQTSAGGGANDYDDFYSWDYDPDPFFWSGGAHSDDGVIHNGASSSQESQVEPWGIGFYAGGGCINLSGYESYMQVEFTVTENATGHVYMNWDSTAQEGSSVNLFIELIDEADENNPLFTDTFSSDEGSSSGTGGYVSLAPGHTYRFRIWNIGLSVESGESGCDLTGNVDISAP